MNKKLMAVLLSTALVSPIALAAPIDGLFNTGASFSTGQVDTHYTLSSPVSALAYVGSGWPTTTGPWIPNDTTSKWLTPAPNASASFDPYSSGTYEYKLTFSLGAFSSANLSGRMAADNEVTAYLNGTQIGYGTSFQNWKTFSANSGFNVGLNTLVYKVLNGAQNGGNPTGLRVEFTSSNVSPVPEPETYAMFLAGLGLIGAIARRKKQVA